MNISNYTISPSHSRCVLTQWRGLMSADEYPYRELIRVMKMNFLRFRVSSLERPLKGKLTARRPSSILCLLLYFPHDVLVLMMGSDESFGIILVNGVGTQRKEEKKR